VRGGGDAGVHEEATGCWSRHGCGGLLFGDVVHCDDDPYDDGDYACDDEYLFAADGRVSEARFAKSARKNKQNYIKNLLFWYSCACKTSEIRQQS
jgi:hypothetical protein